MPEVTELGVPWALWGLWGPGSVGELGLNWKQVLGTSRRKGAGGRKGGGAWGGTAGGGSGVHIWQRGGGVAGSIVLAQPPRAWPPRGPGGPRCCQMLCSCLWRFLSPRAPHPPGSSSLRFLGGESGGRPLQPPCFPSPGFLSLWLCLLQLFPHWLIPPSPPPPFSSLFLLPADPQPWGGLTPQLPPHPGAASCAPALCHVLSSSHSPGWRGGWGGGNIRHHLFLFFPVLSKHFAFSHSSGAGLARSCPAPNQPRPLGQRKAGRAAASRGCGNRGRCGSQGRWSSPAARTVCRTQIGFGD